MNIIFIRSNPITPDSRVEKEVNSLLKMKDLNIQLLGWDRTDDYNLKRESKKIGLNSVPLNLLGIKASFGGGFKKNLIPLLKFQIKGFKFLIKNRNEIDIVHACDFDTALFSFIFAKLFRKKIVYDIFDFYVDSFSVPKYLKKMIKKIDFFIIKNSNACIICSEERKRQISGSKPKKLVVIHNSPPNIEIDNELRANKKLKICYIGILANGRLIKELLEIVSNNQNFELDIAGFGELDKDIETFSECYENINYYGKTEYHKTLEIEKNSDVITAIYDPSVDNHFYAAPNKFYEGLMLGKILIMVNNTGMSNYVSEYQIGEVIDYNMDSLETALIKVSNYSEEDKIRVSNFGKKIYKKNFSWDEMEKRLLRLYSEV